MLLQELKFKALNVNAESVLPVNSTLNVEGFEITFRITAFQSGFGSGKKTVISGSIKRMDNGTEKLIENADVEKVRRVVSSLCELTTSGRISERKPRTPKGTSEVDKLRQSLAVARRLCQLNSWVKLDMNELRIAFKRARKEDREREQKALQVRAIAPILEKIEKAKLSDEARALLLASLQ